MRRRVLISHFFNEAYLLPYWIRHHLPLFDHAVLIDYQSTDESVAICRELAPHWEVRPSRNAQFDAALCDAEVMAIEAEFADSWKLAINTTEFFCVRDVAAWFWGLEAHGWDAYALRGMVLSDPPEFEYAPLDPAQPLLAQRWHGFFEDQHLIPGCNFLSRSRLLHRVSHGAYHPGRHWSDHTPFMHPPGAVLAYLLYSPWTPEFVARKVQIASRIPESDRAQGKGLQHFAGLAELEQKRATIAPMALDLRTDPAYWAVLGGWGAVANQVPAPANFAPLAGARYDAPIKPADLAVRMLTLGVQHGQIFAFKLAEDLCRNALDATPNAAHWLVLWAICRTSQGDDAFAEPLFRHALAVAPQRANTHFNHGVWLARRGHTEAADNAMRHAATLDARYAAISPAHFALQAAS